MAVSLTEMKAHLNVNTTFDDEIISTYLTAALDVVVGYLGYTLDSDLKIEMGTPDSVIDQATRVICADMYRDRENTSTSERYDFGLSMDRLLGQYKKINIVY